ncbi:hypothetical protein C1646_751420 [Rhizophagus diaphanus]|nr:hypothetical protein C1646_751420 [Rhizophagus diaphanus] [Rhizophagus sp. MUCL 43196]
MSSKNYSGQAQEAYEALCSVEEEIKRTAEFNPEPLPGKFLVEPLSVLINKPSSSWTMNDVMPVVKFLSGRIVVDGVGENLEGAQLLRWHHTINATIPVHQYPPSGNPATPVVPLMGTTHTWVFQGQEGLKHGIRQSKSGGILLTITKNSSNFINAALRNSGPEEMRRTNSK